MFGLLLGIADYEYGLTHVDSAKIDTLSHPDALQHPRTANTFSCLSRLIIFITSLIAIICLLIRRYYVRRWTQTYSQNDNIVDPT